MLNPVLTVNITTQAAASTTPVDLILAAGEGRLHDVQLLLMRGRYKVNDEDEVCIPCI